MPASLILGFMLALALERLENGFRIDTEIERHLHIPSLGLVPHMSDLEAGESLSARVINKPLSSYTESIRALQFGIDLFDVDNPPKVILVTSPLPNEGKTTLACSLARLAAASGKKTLLLDADLRHPTVQRTLGVKQQSKNLTDFLSTPTDIESMTSTDSISPLQFISLGSNKVFNPSSLLASDKMKNLISTLRDAYNVVIIDSAPLMPVTDTRLLARLVDVSLFAVRWQKTPREAAKSALRLLADTGVPIVGAAMTFVDMRRHSLYGYGYGAAGYYGRYYSKYYED